MNLRSTGLRRRTRSWMYWKLLFEKDEEGDREVKEAGDILLGRDGTPLDVTFVTEAYNPAHSERFNRVCIEKDRKREALEIFNEELNRAKSPG